MNVQFKFWVSQKYEWVLALLINEPTLRIQSLNTYFLFGPQSSLDSSWYQNVELAQQTLMLVNPLVPVPIILALSLLKKHLYQEMPYWFELSLVKLLLWGYENPVVIKQKFYYFYSIQFWRHHSMVASFFTESMGFHIYSFSQYIITSLKF